MFHRTCGPPLRHGSKACSRKASKAERSGRFVSQGNKRRADTSGNKRKK